jgi:hypothetical protein
MTGLQCQQDTVSCCDRISRAKGAAWSGRLTLETCLRILHSDGALDTPPKP